jgi:hypothetical protein
MTKVQFEDLGQKKVRKNNIVKPVLLIDFTLANVATPSPEMVAKAYSGKRAFEKASLGL